MTDKTPQQIRNRKTKDRKKRRKFRSKLEAQGVPPERIDQILEQRAREDRAARLGHEVYKYDLEAV